MANTITNRTLFDGNNRIIVLYDLRSDGTEESNTVIIDKSTLTGPHEGNEPSSLDLEWIEWSVGVKDTNRIIVTLEWDHTSNVLIAQFGSSEEGRIDFTPAGNLRDTGSGSTGDVIISTEGLDADDMFRFYMSFKKNK